jgi:hypothetical protein
LLRSEWRISNLEKGSKQTNIQDSNFLIRAVFVKNSCLNKDLLLKNEIRVIKKQMICIRLFILSFILTLLSVSTIAQKVTVHVFMENKTAPETSDTIYYDFNRKLAWKDFQEKPQPGVPWGAMTASGFSFNSPMNIDGDKIDITVGVFTFFIKHDSWKKPDINSDYHLEHEQRHFDITRLYAQKLMEDIKKANFTGSNFKQLLNSIFDKAYDENIAMQHQYDLETKNSMDVQKQRQWNLKISGEIEKLKYEK